MADKRISVRFGSFALLCLLLDGSQEAFSFSRGSV